MKIVIISAMQEEQGSVINACRGDYVEKKNANFTFYQGKYQEHELSFILCGIGKVNAAITTQYMIDKVAPDLVVNVGVAGGLDEGVKFGDVVIASDLVHHDMDVVAFNIPLGQVPRMEVFSFVTNRDLVEKVRHIEHQDFKIHVGRIVSGDQFIADEVKAKFLANQFNALACEMEGAAIAHTCYVNKTSVIVIRAMSDQAGISGNGIHSFLELKEMAANRAGYMVFKLIELI